MKTQAQHPSLHHLEVMPLSCPDCSGVLSRAREGSSARCYYICQVGHRYSTASLLQSKEIQLERVVWSATVLLKQMGDTYEQLVTEMPEKDSERKLVQQRMKEVRKQSLAIRRLIEETHALQ